MSEGKKLDKKNSEMSGQIWSHAVRYCFVIALALFIVSLDSADAIPNSINIIGKLTDSNGAAIVGNYNFSFRIYDNYTAGNRLFQMQTNLTTDSNGIYDVILQAINLNFSDQYYLGVAVFNDAEMSPRINLTTSPYAFRANVSESLNPNNNYKVSNLNVTGDVNGSRIFQAGNQVLDSNAIAGFYSRGNFSSDFVNNGGINSSNSSWVQSSQIKYTNSSFDLSQILNTAQVNIGEYAFTVGGGFGSGGLTIQEDGTIKTDGDIWFSGNITILEVDNLRVNASFYPSIDNSFSIGNASLRWLNGNFSGIVNANKFYQNFLAVLDTSHMTSTLYNRANGTSDYNSFYGWKLENLTGKATNLTLLNVSGQTLLAVGGGNVGIGTTNPGTKLDVVGSNALDLIRLGDGTDDYGWQISSGGSLVLSEAGVANRFTLEKTTGNIGIGTTTPVGILHASTPTVGKSANITVANSNSEELVYIRLLEGFPSAGTYGGMLKYNGATNYFHLGTFNDGAEINAISIERVAGAVGINDTTPDATLEVSGNFMVSNPSTSDGNLLFVRGDGNVGIGTTSPSHKLQVDGTINASGLNISGNVGLGYNGGKIGLGGIKSPRYSVDVYDLNPNLFISSSTWASGNHINISFQGSDSYIQKDYDNGLILDDNNKITLKEANTAVVTIDGSEVGIGTTDPLKPLHIQGSSTGFQTVLINSTDDDGAGILFSSQYGGKWLLFNTGASSSTGADTFSLFDYNANRYALVINKTSGHLGVGTATANPTNPIFQFTAIHPTTTDTRWRGLGIGYDNTNEANRWFTVNQINDGGTSKTVLGQGIMGRNSTTTAPSWSSTNAKGVGIEMTDSDISLFTSAQGNNQSIVRRLTVENTNGNVGINTTSPTKALHVVGEFTLNATGSRQVFTNGTCVIIQGPTSQLAVC